MVGTGGWRCKGGGASPGGLDLVLGFLRRVVGDDGRCRWLSLSFFASRSRAKAFRPGGRVTSFCLPRKKVTKKEGTPRPRLPRVVRGKSPAVLAKRRPLRNSHIHVLGHARFPLRFAPLLGAPEGPHVPSTRLPAWFLRWSGSAGLRGLSGRRPEPTAMPEPAAMPEPTTWPKSVGRSRIPSRSLLRRSRFAAHASLSTPVEQIDQEAGLEDQAGSRVEGEWGPSGAPRSGGGSRGKRACSSTGVSDRTLAPHAARGRERPAAMPTGRTSELRSGLDPASTAGDPVCTTHTGRGSGVAFLLVTSLWPFKEK